MTTTEIVERIMTAHWDMVSCNCWICQKGHDAGCRPKEEYLLHKDGNREKYPIPYSGEFKP